MGEKMKKHFLCIFTVFMFVSNMVFAERFTFNKVEGETIAVFAPLLSDSVPVADKAWLPDVIQGKLVNAFFTYSTFLPFDQGITSLAVEQVRESNTNALYDQTTMIEAGKQIQAKYYAYVEISYHERSQIYNMNFYILETESGKHLVSVSDGCTREQLRVKNGDNAIYRSMYNMLNHWRMNEAPYKKGQFQKAENWAELEAFVNSGKKR